MRRPIHAIDSALLATIFGLVVFGGCDRSSDIVGPAAPIQYAWRSVTGSPTASDLADVCSYPGGIIAVGTAGVIVRYDGATWTTESLGDALEISRVVASDPRHVYLQIGPSIWWNEGDDWSLLTTCEGFSGGLWSGGPNDLWYVRFNAYHFDGSFWTRHAYPLPPCPLPPPWACTWSGLNGVWDSSPADVFAVGPGGTIVHYDGSTWSWQPAGTERELQGVWGSGPADVFAVGEAGTILHYDGSAWSAQESGVSVHLTKIWGSGPADVYVLGQENTVLRYDGIGWSAMPLPATLSMQGIAGLGPGKPVLVGSAGAILQYDSGEWSSPVGPTSNLLHAVWGSSPVDVFAVGAQGTIVHFDGATWALHSSGTTSDLRSVWGSSPDNVFVVGDSGTMLHFDGVSWGVSALGSSMLLDVWGTGTSDVFAVGMDGAIVHSDGTAWVPQVSGTTAHLIAISGRAHDDLYAVGSEGTVLHFDGSSWTPVPGPSSRQLTNVWVTESGEVYVLDLGGDVSRLDPSGWTLLRSGDPTELWLWGGLWYGGPEDLLIAGTRIYTSHASAVISRFDGQAWSNEPTGLALNELFTLALWGTSPDHVLAVGPQGTILQRGPR